ncbi:MAG: hypothetical protein OHK0022_08670 [Roseiflexaceae bacterium]
MTKISQRLAALSPEQRRLLEQRMQAQGLQLPAAQAQAIFRRADPAAPTPLSFPQQRMWFLEQLMPGSPAYHVRSVARIDGPLDVQRLEQSINQVVQRHEILRTHFIQHHGEPRQHVAPTLWVPLELVDLGGLDPTTRETALRERARTELRRPFDLARGPLLRCCLLRLGDHQHVFIFTLHHSIADGWSVGLFNREMVACYATPHGQLPVLPELPIQYGDFALWQHRQLQEPALEQLLGYWRGHLAGAPLLLELRTNQPRPPQQTGRGATVFFNVPQPLTARIKQLGQQANATLFMTLVAAFAVVLRHHGAPADLLIGTDVAGRTLLETEHLIGFFVNQLVLRLRLTDQDGFDVLLRQTRDVALAAYAHQELPFEKLVEALNPPRDSSRTPLFQVKFVLQPNPLARFQAAGLTVIPEEIDSQTAKFDLLVNMLETEQGLRGAWEYSSDLFEPATARRMVAQFVLLLEQICAQPQTPLLTLLQHLVEDDQRQRLVEARRFQQTIQQRGGFRRKTTQMATSDDSDT